MKMKNFVEGLAVVLVVSQATACVIYDDTEPVEAASITARWSFHNIATDKTTACPAGFDTVALNNQELDVDGRPIGQPYIDLFDCADGSGISAPLAPSVYQTWISVTNTDGTQTYADSLSAIVDVIDTDKTFTASILNDGGYFQLSWDLVGATSNQPLACSDVPGLASIESIGTSIASPDIAAADKFTCGDHAGVTGGFLQGAYTVSITALDRNDRALSEPVNLANQKIAARNRVTDLGHVEIPITGR
ncbi:MAG TPA: hypothetical protein VFQ53_34460 [Kofleriaceae bacterium]|nr:hypothetical protein [Kofleriaceae bacterium]